MACLLVLGFAFFSYAEVNPQGPPKEEAFSVSKKEEPAPAPTVTAIEIKGNKAISANAVISKMKTKVGAAYLENVVSEDLKRLYLLGFFSDIKIDTENYKDGIKVIITVVERPIIEKIIFSGHMHITMKDEKLKETLKSKEGQYLDYPSLAEDVQTFKNMYDKMGFSRAEINYKVDLNKETNKAKINFDIVEGKKMRIKNISIEGNKAFSSRKILKLLKTKAAWLFNAGVLKEEVLKEDMDRIKAFYRKNGFIDVAVDYSVNADPKKPFYYITIKIQEGKKFFVGSVFIQGNKDISEKEILGRVKEAIPDKVFNSDAVKQDAASIQGLYFDRGYISAQVQDTTSVDPATNRVNISYSIVENEITYVDKIRIIGNVKTKDVVIRRELRIKPGDKFDGDKLRRSKERLQNLGFFEDISYDTKDTATPTKKDLVVDVKESKTGAFSFGGGYSTVDQFVGFVEVEQKNFDWRNFPYFTGAGQNLKFRFSTGSETKGLDLSYTEPWLFDYPVSFGFDAYRHQHSRDTDVGYGYDEDITGGDVRMGKDFSEYVQGSIAYRYENIKISNPSDGASQDLLDEVGTNGISSMEFGLNFDNRDNVFDPTRGNLVTTSWSVAGGPLSGDKDFWKFFGRASHYIPLVNGSVLEFKGRIGLADPYSNTSKIPIYERYFAGGADTIRGYRERKIGPVDPNSKDPLGGDALLVGNVEYTYPLFSFLRVACFYDIGNVWQNMRDIGSNKDTASPLNDGGFKSGIGFGVRIKTPVGPVRLDYGIPMNKETGEDTKGHGRFHFSMSHSF